MNSLYVLLETMKDSFSIEKHAALLLLTLGNRAKLNG